MCNCSCGNSSNALLWILQKPSHLLSSRGDFIGVHTGQLEDTFGVAVTAASALSSCTIVVLQPTAHSMRANQIRQNNRSCAQVLAGIEEVYVREVKIVILHTG